MSGDTLLNKTQTLPSLGCLSDGRGQAAGQAFGARILGLGFCYQMIEYGSFKMASMLYRKKQKRSQGRAMRETW